MNKRLLAGALSLTLGTVATSVSAYEIAITSMTFNTISVASGTIDKTSMGDSFNGVFFSAPWTAVTQSFYDVGSGAGSFAGDTAEWDPHNYVFSLTGTQLAYGTHFNWSVNTNIPVLAILDCASATPSAGDTCTGTGTPMQVGPFPGQSPAFGGVVAYDSSPSFSSAATANSAENSAGTVYTASASAGTADTPTYSITGGADALDFSIDGAGALSFSSAPNFEGPADADTNNTYVVEITATWASAAYTTNAYTAGGAVAGTVPGTSVAQTVTITVTDVNEASPVFTSGTTISVDENLTATGYTAQATDADTAQDVNYFVTGGVDAALFRILDSSTGVLTFVSGRDFESATDDNADGDYIVEITATDNGTDPGTNSTAQTVTVSVTNVDPEPFDIVSAPTASFTEGATGVVYTAIYNGTNLPITFNALTGTDATAFNFNTTNGELTFITPPDREAQASYSITVGATDNAAAVADLAVTITITDTNDEAPVFTSSTTASMVENTTTAYTVTSNDPDTTGEPTTYTITGGADASLFDINAGVVSFNNAPDFETPTDAGADNDYVVEITASDTVNTSSQTVTISVTNDTTLPVVTASNSCPVVLDEGETFTAPSATAVDTLDGDISNDIVITDPVDTSVPGDYSVTYNVSNSESVAATEATCLVTVRNKPRIFINGAAVINLELGNPYTDLGARATDVEDGVLAVASTGRVTPGVAGTYDITYSAVDSHNNITTAIRRVIVRGAAGAVLGVRSISITGGEFALGTGAFDPMSPGDITPFNMGEFQGSAPASSAADTQPGSVYNSTSLAAFSFQDFGPVGVYTADTDGTAANVGLALPSGTVDTVNSSITLTIPSWIAYWNGNSFAQGPTTAGGTKIDGLGTFDSTTNAYNISWDALVVGGAFDGQTGHWNISGIADLVEADSVLPVITLTGSSQIALQAGSAYIEPGVATATDNIDTLDIANVSIVGGIDVNTVGTYTITYSIADSSGNVGIATREIVVFDSPMPVIMLNGNASVGVAFNSIYVEQGATAGDSIVALIGGDTVDTSVVGTYIVTYDFTNSNGIPAFQVTRTVIVIDVTSPVITPTGDNPVYLLIGATYIDEGATATDDVDTNPGLTNKITTDNPVNTDVEGTYTVTYSVTDNDNNSSTATRTVFVDNTGPAITIIGNSSIALPVGSSFSDEGANAIDVVSGSRDVTADCTGVDTTIAGRYTCIYTATDDAGNETTIERVITILDTIVPTEPVLTVSATQNGETTSIVIIGDNIVTVTTNIPSIPGFFDAFDWSTTDNNILAAVDSGDVTNTSLMFNPANLDPGIYDIVVITNGGTDREVTSHKLLTVVSSVPDLATDADTDGDGVTDSVEGIGDDDNDGIPNFLDDSRLAVTEVSVDGSVMMSSTGILRLGDIAFAAADVATAQFSSQVDLTDIAEHGGSAGGLAPANTGDTDVASSCVGGCFDFDVADLEPGSTVDVVIPLSEPIGNNMAYRKYTTVGGWVDFDTSGVDAIATSGMVNGICPEPNASNRWVDGLFEGDTCIRLTIQDGGANDADGAANGVVSDPSGAADLPPAAGPKTGFADGCSATDRIVNPWERSDWLLIALFIALIGMRRKLLVR